MAFIFQGSVKNGLKLKVRKNEGLISILGEVTGKKLVEENAF